MLVCSQVALLIAGMSLAPETAPVAQPAEPSLPPTAESTTELISREFARSLAALPQGTRDAHAQPWFVSGGFHFIQADYSVNVLGGADFSDNPGYSIDVGFTKWSDELGVALEGGLLKSSTDVDIGAINSETVDSLRFLVGVRAFDRGSDTWLPYLRGGFMWRTDSGDSIDDSGSGWYVGGGFDFYLGSYLRAGPQLLYTDSSSLNAKEWILGAVVTFAF
jgi:Outer membrane protein beta-barrel domain